MANQLKVGRTGIHTVAETKKLSPSRTVQLTDWAERIVHSVTRLGDLLNFGQLFKDFGNI